MNPPQSDPPVNDMRRYFEEPEAWTQVSQGLQRIALAIVGNERDAEDVVQGAWLEALKNPENQRSQGWMRRLVRFRALDSLRRKQRDPVVFQGELPEGQETSGTNMRWKLEAQREVLDAVNALKEPYLSTVVLRYFEGQGPKDIAARLGVPERTIKTRLTRAHGMLRERLGARYQDQFGNWAPALLLFSGSGGLKVGPLSVPVVGLTLMKKTMLIAAVVAAVWMIPFALQSVNGAPEETTLSNSGAQELVHLESEVQAPKPAEATRETVPEVVQETPAKSASPEYAFPLHKESESGSLGINVRWSDGSPAQRLKIGVMPQNAGDAFIESRTVYTDSSGYVKVERVPAGPVSVFFHRLGVEKVEVVAGEYLQIEKEARLGTTFTGQVLSPTGQPVGGAQIYVADSRGGDSLPEPTAIADNTGRYEIKNVYDRSYVSARASGFSPSIPIETGISTGPSMTLDLTLRGQPATLRGLALSPKGQPVIGAKLRINLGAVKGSTARNTGFPLSFVLETDEEGRFETDKLGAGIIKVMARTAMWQPWQETLQLQPEEDREIIIQFERGVTLTGVVRGEDGEPIPRTRLFIGKTASLGSHRAQTDQDGKYRFHGLHAGTTDIKVFQKKFEELDTQVTLRSDTTNQFDFTLHKLQTASGVVVDERGAPLERWYVAVESQRGLWSAGSWTNVDGEFEVVGIPDGTTDLIVTNEDYWGSATRLALPSMLPARGPLRIVVPDSAVPNSSIRMKLLVEGSAAPVETKVRLRSASPLTHRDVHPEADGSVHMQTLASRAFHLEVALEGYATIHRSFQLGISEDLDLGTLQLEKGGRVHVRVQGPLGESGGTLHMLDGRGKSMTSFALSGTEAVSPPLPSGPILLRYNPVDGATQFAEAEVVAGETTQVRFMARQGTNRKLPFIRKGGQPLRFRTVASVTDAQGHVHFFSKDLARQRGSEGTTTIQLAGLELGTYRIQLKSPGGQMHESWLVVDSLRALSEEPAPTQLDW